jgi:hypothetical protein
MVGLLLASPAAAQAADAYVDFETGVDGGTCGAMVTPCKTISFGIDRAGVGEIVRVDDRPGTSSYANVSGFFLGSGKSLVAEEFVGGDEGSLAEPDTIIEGGEMVMFSPTVKVPAGTTGSTIQGFRIRSLGTTPVRLESTATLIGNTIDEDLGTNTGCFVEVLNSGNTSAIGPNTFIDPTPAATPQAGVCVTSSAAPSINSNTFTDLNHGVQSGGGNSTISSNTFSGIRGATTNAPIEVTSGSPTITANLIQSPGDTAVIGIALQQTAIGATLRRNRILGYRVGLVANNTNGAVDLNGDLIAKSTNVALAMNDTDDDDDANVTATNVTLTDSGSGEVIPTNADLTLNSSIIGATGIMPAGGATCAISFSRGPTMTPGGTGCANFQTTAAPGFVNPAANDYHLAAGSAMIDMGDPLPPGGGILDLDGQARATDGNGDGITRRDIGADETPTLALPAAIPPATPGGASKKKCKKKRKKRAAGAKRKKCKRKKR